MARGSWTKEVWINAALQAISRGGVAAVAVDTLASDLGATRGSFYWHFKDREALLEAAMAAWEDLETTQVEERLVGIVDPYQRIRTLFRIALLETDDPIPGLEPAIYAQPEHPAVAPTLRRVTDRRLQILAAGYRELGLKPAAARRQSVHAYATYIGWLQLRRTSVDLVPEVATSGRKASAAVNLLLDQLIPAPLSG